MKAIAPFILSIFISSSLFAQDSTQRRTTSEKKQRTDAIIRQEEEGAFTHTRQNGFGIMLRTNGYGIWFEIGRRKTQRWTDSYSAELTEIKHPKEEKVQAIGFSSPYVYGKINNFYQFKLGYGRQYFFGNKGNKNGVALIGVANAGVSAGLLKPYYINLDNGESIKWSVDDSSRFLSRGVSGSGFLKGWGDLKVKPGLFAKTAIRLDLGKFNESIHAVEVGFSFDYYFSKIEILAPVTEDKDASGPRTMFFQAHIAYVFGRRK